MAQKITLGVQNNVKDVTCTKKKNTLTESNARTNVLIFYSLFDLMDMKKYKDRKYDITISCPL
jgi:hypothetical protein